MGLFDRQEAEHLAAALPLAARMRPRSLDEFVGQEHFLGPGKLLRRMLQADRIQSVIFYGPPGTGKTTLAQIIARHTQSHFAELNAASVGVSELRAALTAARDRLAAAGERTVLFIDELHRFNRTQQDVLLPEVEQGVVRLIGATTANPFFSLVSPLVSRSQVFEFRPLSCEDICGLLRRAVSDCERGLGTYNVEVTDEALEFFAHAADGDARRALNALEVAVLSIVDETGGAAPDAAGRKRKGSGSPEQCVGGRRLVVDRAVAEDSIQRKALEYDADTHYDIASAFIKSIRGSDPDAAIYWLARMLEAGEDPRFIARRLVIAAAEDIGNADPQALPLATAAQSAAETIGMPECRIPLAQATSYLACAPKSNSAIVAIDRALKDVRTQQVLPVPMHLRDAHYSGAKRLGHGDGYQYAHASADGWVDQDYLGTDRVYYEPVDRGFEAELQQRLAELRQRREATPPANKSTGHETD